MKRRITIEIPETKDVRVSRECRVGRPCVRQSHFLLSQLLAELAERNGVEPLAEDYDYPVEDFRCALNWVAQVLDQDFSGNTVDLGVILEETWVVRDKTTGWWWQPDSRGYTPELLAAGATDKAEAAGWAQRKTPFTNGEAMSLAKALEHIGEGTVFHEIFDHVKGPEPWCHECEVEVQVDEDGCCALCGVDVFHDENGNPMNGRDRKIADLRQQIDSLRHELKEAKEAAGTMVKGRIASTIRLGPITDLETLRREYAVERWTWDIIDGKPTLWRYVAGSGSADGVQAKYVAFVDRFGLSLYSTDDVFGPPELPADALVALGCAHLGVPTPPKIAERLEASEGLKEA